MPRFYPSKPSPTIFNDLSDSGRKNDSKSVQCLCAIAHRQKIVAITFTTSKPIQWAIFKLMQFSVKLQAMISAGV
ncbi:MAG: hypothetical protein DID90_2727553240 [Candidatus Nitrotoga sp. LAW]|nr:MAG: hypothetical protein DID90_2727553240 [Candidatus Nitrotoga sp. LAW]